MRFSLLTILVVMALTACPAPTGVDGGTGGRRTGTGGGSALSAFNVIELDPNAGQGIPSATPDAGADGGVDGYQGEASYFAIAVDPVAERVGVVYYAPAGKETVPGTQDYNINYLEYSHQTGVVTAPQTVRFVQRKIGISLQFDPVSKEPVIAYLGGASGFIPGQSISWFQNDASLNQRSNGTTWTESTVARNSSDVPCGNGPSEAGFLVGVWPSIVFDAAGKLVYGYRDCHNGQFPMQDWGASDVEIWDGTPGSLVGHCVNPGGNNKGAWGGHLQLVEGAAQPAVIYDQMFGTSDTNGKNVIFQQRGADGKWSAGKFVMLIGNTQTGASMAYDPTEGFGIAAVDRDRDVLYYINSLDGVTWNERDQVYGSGSGGWYPSLAMDPVYHEPAIAFYVCSNRSGINDTACSTTDDELFIAQRVEGNWQQISVDKNGGFAPKIGFFASGKRFVVYRTPPAVDPGTGKTVTNVGILKIAVER